MAKPRYTIEEQHSPYPGRCDSPFLANPADRAAEPRRSRRLKRSLPIDEGREGSKRDRITTPLNPRKWKRPNKPKDGCKAEANQTGTRSQLYSSISTTTKTKSPAVRKPHPSLDDLSPVSYWTREGRWPKQYFHLDANTHAYITRDPDEESLWRKLLSDMERPDPLGSKEGHERMRALLARKRSSSSLCRTQSGPGSIPSNQRPREEKSASYLHVRYETVLATKQTYLNEDSEGLTAESTKLCHTLLQAPTPVLKNSLFDDDIFRDTCEEIRRCNEAKVIRDIAQLIVPSPRRTITRGPNRFHSILVESVNEGWNNSIPLTGSRPQPDYSVGLARTAFSDEQLNKLQPFVGELTDTSFFMATFYMYFPFLTCEVKCEAATLDVADRQNAHSMTLAVRGVVELFKLVYREKELDRQILAFSVSHDHRTVRIYGHYPVIGEHVAYYRYPIHTFDFTVLDGKEKWTAYKFTKNVYDVWVPEHFKRLCSVIDQLPAGVNFELSEQSELQFQDTGLSQDFRDSNLSHSNADSVSFQGDGQESASGVHDTTPETSISYPPAFKKPKKRPAAE